MAALISVAVCADTKTVRNFELPLYHFGSLEGQQGWKVDGNTWAQIQGAKVFDGTQALAMSMTGNYGAAWQPTLLDLSGGFYASAAIAADMPRFADKADGFSSAFVRLDTIGMKGETVAIDFGTAWGPIRGPLPSSKVGCAAFAQVTVNGQVVATAQGPVRLMMPLAEYHVYGIAYDNSSLSGRAVLTVDGVAVASIPLHLSPLMMQGLLVVSQRPLGTVATAGRVYFDQIGVAPALP